MQEKNTKVGAEKIFALFDKDNTKKITLDSLKKMVEETEEYFSQEELQDILYRASSDGNGNFILFEEFKNAMMKNIS